MAQLDFNVVQYLLHWAIGRWEAEVKHRPVENVYRRVLDNTWRQVMRKLVEMGGDAGLLPPE